MTDPDDILARSEALDREILAIPKDRVFTKRAVITGFLVITAVVCIGFGWTFRKIDDNTGSTNNAVTQEIPGLKAQIKDRDQRLATNEDLLRQATDAIVLLLDLLDEHGIKAPPIRIEPTTTTAPAD